jgi:hypothetical protein
LNLFYFFQVLLVNLFDGSHVKKKNANTSAAYYEESGVKHILPLMTQPFNFRYEMCFDKLK